MKNPIDVKLQSLGNTANHFEYEILDGKVIITFNTDHPYIHEVIKPTSLDEKGNAELGNFENALYSVYSIINNAYKLEESHKAVSSGWLNDFIENQSNFYKALYS